MSDFGANQCRNRQGAQDAVDTLETFEAFEAFDKHGLPAFVRGVDAEALYFFLALFRTGTLPRAAEQLGISLSSANRMLAKLRTYWDDPLFVGISDAADHSGQTPL